MDYWDKTIILRFDEKNSKALPIKDAKDAARVLLKSWPVMQGNSYRRAILNCSAALHGRAPQDAAQWAFIVAAMEAAIAFEIVDRFETEIGAVCMEMLAEEMPPQQYSAPAVDMRDPTPLFWWPRRQASGRLAQ